MGLYARYFPIFSGWTQYTPVIPKQYWDVYSQEQRIKWLCMEWDRIREYLDRLVGQQNDNNKEMGDNIQKVAEQLDKLQAVVDDLVNQMDDIDRTLPTYDPTQGKYNSSQDTNRNMYRELAVFGARTAQMATKTVAEAAEHTTLETAVVGNLTIFGDHTPRVTSVGH